jgi:hypothetical protein
VEAGEGMEWSDRLLNLQAALMRFLGKRALNHYIALMRFLGNTAIDMQTNSSNTSS